MRFRAADVRRVCLGGRITPMAVSSETSIGQSRSPPAYFEQHDDGSYSLLPDSNRPLTGRWQPDSYAVQPVCQRSAESVTNPSPNPSLRFEAANGVRCFQCHPRSDAIFARGEGVRTT